MARRIAITVHPSATATLTVADAMRQVLDIIETMEHIEADAGAAIVWRLDSASASSPFTVVASAQSPDPGLSVALEANRVTEAFISSLNGLLREDAAPDALDHAVSKSLERIFRRNLNGVGRTDIGFPDSEAATIFIEPAAAQRGLITIERFELSEAEREPNLARSEFGAREGNIAGIATYYGDPALAVLDRVTGARFMTVLTPDLAKRLGPEHNWSEAWEGRRVLITGALHFDAAGRLRKVEAEELEPVTPSTVTLADLEGIDLLGGRSVSEHLAGVWGSDG